MDKVFKALADSNRRKLLDMLYVDNGQTLSDLCRFLEMSRQAVTKHLNILEKANLVSVIWRGREKLHYLNPVPINDMHKRWINKYEHIQLDNLAKLKQTLEEGTKNESRTARK